MRYLISTILFLSGLYIGTSFNPILPVGGTILEDTLSIELAEKDIEIASLTEELERRGNIRAKRVFIDDNLTVDLDLQTMGEVIYTVGDKTCTCK